MGGFSTKSSGLLLLVLLIGATVAAPVTESSASASEESTETANDHQEEDLGVDTPLEASLGSFLELVPAPKIQNMTTKAYLDSSVVREASNFLRSPEFRDAKEKLLEAPEVQEFVKFLNQSGLNLIRFVRKVGRSTGIPVTVRDGEEPESSEENTEEEDDEEAEQAVLANSEAAAVLTQLVDKLLAELPQEQFFALFFEKMEADSEMSEFVERLNGDEFEAILLKLQVGGNK